MAAAFLLATLCQKLHRKRKYTCNLEYLTWNPMQLVLVMQDNTDRFISSICCFCVEDGVNMCVWVSACMRVCVCMCVRYIMSMLKDSVNTIGGAVNYRWTSEPWEACKTASPAGQKLSLWYLSQLALEAFWHQLGIMMINTSNMTAAGFTWSRL